MRLRVFAKSLIASLVLAFSLVPWAAASSIYYPTGPGARFNPDMTILRVGPERAPYVDSNPKTKSGTWADVQAPLPFADGPDTAILLTDATVAMHDWCTGNWFRLTPDIKGKYETGSWSALATMPAGYYPFYFASQILPDGRLIVNGGEYNKAGGKCGSQRWTRRGALYDPVSNSWTPVSPPRSWQYIGDAQSAVLADGSYMLANCCTEQQAIATISGTRVKWSATGAGKADENSEEGWNLLPDGSLLTVDAWNGIDNTVSSTEIYSPSSGSWSAGQNTASQLASVSHEVGPAVLLPTGYLVYFGADLSTGANNLFDPATGAWAAAPGFPVIDGGQYDCADAPAALLPDGNAIVDASPYVFRKPSHFFEFAMT